jgi:hypothetical protein
MVRMTLAEIERAYPNEWVVVGDYTADDSVMVHDGIVLAHSANKSEVLRSVSSTPGDLALWFVGRPFPNDVIGFVGICR